MFVEEQVKKSDPKDVPIESIGWLFIQRYYSAYTTDIKKLYELYDKDAVIYHESFPDEKAEGEQKNVKTAHVARGNNSITEFFKNNSDSPEVNKIVIESAQFQNSVGASILISVSGTWKKGASNLKHFVQTFILTSKEHTVYDVSNDILKYLDMTEEIPQTKVVTVEAAEKAAPEDVAQEKVSPEKVASEKEVASVTEEKKEKEETHATEPPKSAASEAVSEAPSEVVSDGASEITSEAPSEVASEAPSEASVSEAESQEPESKKEEVPAQKPTWATLAAIEPKTPSRNVAVSTSTPNSAAASSTIKPPVIKKFPSPPQPMQNIRYKKEEWYPIYIKNVEVEEDELKSALIKQFGDIKYFKKSSKTALCDFKQKEDQLKALEAKEITIRNNRILLEQRVHRAYNGKPDAKKDKKLLKKPPVKKA